MLRGQRKDQRWRPVCFWGASGEDPADSGALGEWQPGSQGPAGKPGSGWWQSVWRILLYTLKLDGKKKKNRNAPTLFERAQTTAKGKECCSKHCSLHNYFIAHSLLNLFKLWMKSNHAGFASRLGCLGGSVMSCVSLYHYMPVFQFKKTWGDLIVPNRCVVVSQTYSNPYFYTVCSTEACSSLMQISAC